MPSDAEIARFLCERVLGWEGPRMYSYAPTPDFLSWAGFGLLLTALAEARRLRSLTYEELTLGQWTASAFAILPTYGKYPREHTDPDPRRALMLAAAKAYGVEV